MKLTKRQQEVLSLCARFPNSTTSELAQKMGVANSTLRNLLSEAYRALGVNEREAAVIKAIKLELIPAYDMSFPKGKPGMAGDSTTDAPPPEKKKMQKGK